LDEQPYIDQTYRYGSTMGGNFQQHQGIEFNAGGGTPVTAIASGDVVFAGRAEADALTVVIRHDRQLETETGTYFVFSTYYHNTRLHVAVGDRVRPGDLISQIGNTGRATNDHLHMEIHATPYDSLRLVVDPNERYPRFTTNPELWIEPLPGTGIVAGQVWDGAGEPVQQARIYGLEKAEPQETPFSFVETYGDRTRGTPAYREHFAVSDVPPGDYVLTVDIDGALVARRVVVDPGKLTWVEFRP
jgi:murein DD-endopeptidase MepM/ murein hydrolase activator NlpD